MKDIFVNDDLVSSKKKKSKRLIVWTAIILLIVAVAGVVVFFVLNGDKPIDYSESAITENTIFEEKVVTLYDEKTNEAINKILSIKYTGKDGDFIAYDFYSQPRIEYEALKESGIDYENLYNPDNFPINYAWYENGVINEEILYNKIKQNTLDAGYSISVDCENLIRLVAEIIPYNIDLLKKKFPDFNFNISFYNIDNLTVTIDDQEEGVYAYYISSENAIYFNTVNMEFESQDSVRAIASHELFHMLNNRITEFNDVLIYGSNYDYSCSGLDCLCVDFLGELTVDSFALEAVGHTRDSESYVTDNNCLDLLCLSTGKDELYFKRFAFGMDDAALYNSFEEEVRNINYVYSTTDALDYACYQKNVGNIGVKNEHTFVTDAEIYGCVNIMKNAYIRMIKEINSGKLTYEEACTTLDEMNDLVFNTFIFEREDYDKIIADMDAILEEYCQTN